MLNESSSKTRFAHFFRSAFVVAAITMLIPATAIAASSISAQDARAIAKEATIYGFPLVDSYRIQYSYFVDSGGTEFKAPWNTINNVARVFTPDDKAIQTPNSDTPYSQLGADLRREPLVISVPEVGGGRYYSLQFIDLYTFNFAYVGSRATGSGAGNFLLAGPHWSGEKPQGIKAVIRSETDFDFVLYRTQLFDAADIDNVKKVQAGYKVEPLSQFLGEPAPLALPAVDFGKVEALRREDIDIPGGVFCRVVVGMNVHGFWLQSDASAWRRRPGWTTAPHWRPYASGVGQPAASWRQSHRQFISTNSTAAVQVIGSASTSAWASRIARTKNRGESSNIVA